LPQLSSRGSRNGFLSGRKRGWKKSANVGRSWERNRAVEKKEFVTVVQGFAYGRKKGGSPWVRMGHNGDGDLEKGRSNLDGGVVWDRNLQGSQRPEGKSLPR